MSSAISTPAAPPTPTPGHLDGHLNAQIAEVRADLVWLSAEISVLTVLGQTRPLQPAESTRLAHLRAQSDHLHAHLADLRAAAAAFLN